MAVNEDNSVCGETCTTPTLFSNVAGTCNETTGLCECPEGYDGADSWETFNDCHISQPFRRKIAVFVLTTAVFTCIVALIALVVVSRRRHSFAKFLWRKITRKARKELSKEILDAQRESAEDDKVTVNTGMNLDEGEEREFNDLDLMRDNEFAKPRKASENPEVDAIIQHFDSEAKKRHRIAEKTALIANLRVSIISIVLIAFGVCCGVVAYLSEFAEDHPRSRQEIGLLCNLFFAGACGTIFGGMWFLVDTYYTALPNLRLYGKLFNLKGVLLENPRLFHYLCDFFIIIGTILIIIFSVILPEVAPDDLKLWNQILLIIFAALALLNVLSLLLIVPVLFRVYHAVLDALHYQLEAVHDQLRILKLKEDIGDEPVEEENEEQMISLFHTQKRKKSKVVEQKEEAIVKIETIQREISHIEYVKTLSRMVLILGPGTIGSAFVFLILMIGIEELNHNMFIFFNTIVVVCLISSLVVLYIIANAKLFKDRV